MTRYVQLVRFKKKPSKEIIKRNLESMEREKKLGVQVRDIYWTLGRYDAVVVLDAPDEKTVMKITIGRGDDMRVETMVAVPAEEARKLVE